MQNPFQRPPTTGCPSRLSIEPWPSMTRTAATPGEGLWRLDEARRTFSCQGCRRQVSHLHEIDERIEAPSHRLTRAALRMRQHRPEAAKRGRRGGGGAARGAGYQSSERWQKIRTPSHAGPVAVCLEGVRKTASQPKVVQPVFTDFVQQERRHFDIANPLCRGLGRLTQQHIDVDPSRRNCPVRAPLRHRMPVSVAFQIELHRGALLGCLKRQCGLANLPVAQENKSRQLV